MKKQCIKCKGRFNRIDLWKIGESWLGDQYVCRSCRRSYVPEEKPSKKESSLFGKKKCPVCGEEMSKKDVWKAKKFVKEWICLNCNSLQNEMQKPKFHEKTREELEQEQKRVEDEKTEEFRIYAEFKKKEQERIEKNMRKAEQERRQTESQRHEEKRVQEPPKQYGFDPYVILGLNRNVSVDELKVRFRELIKKNNLAGSINMTPEERAKKEAVIRDLLKAREMISREKGYSS